MRPHATFIFLFFFASLAQGQYYHFETITEQNGLSDNRVTCFLKDRSGFMWIGTANGLNRYDGFQFRIYRPGNTPFKISHEHINDIEQDRKGRLWVATWNGLNVLNTEKDSLYTFTTGINNQQPKKNKLSNALVWDIYADAYDRIWIAPDARDLCYYDFISNTFTHFPWREFVHTALPWRPASAYTSIQKITRKSMDELWLGTTAGLFSFNTRTLTFSYYGGDYTSDFVYIRTAESNHKVFFGQERLYVFRTDSSELKEIIPGKSSSLIKAQNEPIIIPTLKGVWTVDPKTEEASPLMVDDINPFSIHHEKATSIYQHNGIIWIGTSRGIRIYDQHTNLFPFTPVFTNTSALPAGNCYHVLDHEADNKYYVSSYTRDRLMVINKSDGSIQEIASIGGKPLLKCSYTFEDSGHQLWVLTSRHIFVSDTTHLRFSVFPFPTKEDDYLFNDMIEDAEGNFWFASLHYGIFHYNPQTQEWKLFTEREDGLFASRPTSLLSDAAHHKVWIGDYSYGIFQYDLRTKKFQYSGVDPNSPNRLHSALVNDLAQDKDGNIWIATTSGGISKFSYKALPGKNFTTFSIENGLPESTIHAIEVDEHGHLWLASFKGLTCIDTQGKIIRHYDKAAGLPFANLSNTISRNSKGELLTGAGNGFIKFHPDSLAHHTEKFPVVITHATVSDSVVTSDEDPVFSYKQNELLVEFAALTFTFPAQVKYFYKLDGFDDDWIDAGNKHNAHYINLRDGHYTFQVKAIDPTGQESSNIASIEFTITPPFWKQLWFIGILIGIAGYALYSGIVSLQRTFTAQKILNQFATSLYNKNTVKDVFWTIAINCVELLKFEDCVVYLVIPEHEILIQKAAAGPKSREPYQIVNPIEIPIGKGIVGTVAKTGKPEIISDTSKDRRYIVDDETRLSELTVPIIVEGKVFGVIDSENSRKRYFNSWHLHMMKEIAAICSAKISRYFVEEQIRSKVARDLHDDMGSTLSSIKIMSNIALEKRETEASQTYLKSIRQNAALMQESMSDIVWAINPENDSLEKVIIRMKEFTAEILEPQDIYYEFIEDGDFTTARMDLHVRKDFYLIFKEAINNAAKYSRCKRLVVHLTRFAQGIRLRISDDGIGFDSALISNGNGLKNMRYRAESIHAVLQIESVPAEGTSIILRIPLT